VILSFATSSFHTTYQPSDVESLSRASNNDTLMKTSYRPSFAPTTVQSFGPVGRATFEPSSIPTNGPTLSPTITSSINWQVYYQDTNETSIDALEPAADEDMCYISVRLSCDYVILSSAECETSRASPTH